MLISCFSHPILLPLGLAQCAMQIALISLGSTYMALEIPAGVFALYFIQRYYLRTSRQLRILDLESKSPLYQLFTETLEGLITIRAFGWQKQFNSTALCLLDDSQRPYYLLYCIQQWLNLVMDLLVAALAVLLVALALCVTGLSDPGTLGVALTSILAFNQTLQSLINNWTQAETSLGAISRTKSFEEKTPREINTEVFHHISPDWPQGSIDFSDLVVSYSWVLIFLANYIETNLWYQQYTSRAECFVVCRSWPEGWHLWENWEVRRQWAKVSWNILTDYL
jgi:ATP-binding cassette subfamily C (CFTR/MRP) protein 1